MNAPLTPLPPEAPLAMPVQDLHGIAPGSIAVRTSPHGMQVKRLLLLAVTAVIALAASSEVRFALSRDGLSVLDVVLLLFFVPLFAWIAFGFVTSSIGFLQLITGKHPGFTAVPSPASSLRHRTAVLMPVYNESVEATFGRVRAMARSIAEAGGAEWIDFFVLSDSNAFHGKREEAAWREVAAEAPIAVYYRRREKNIARKPGNIAEWVQRFGAAYENMLILDADSLMSGDAIIGMAAIMEERPSIGLLQTVPMIINAQTLFQRWMRFASEAYGPIASAGLLWWSGAEANFWGHNAIVRTRAFADSCGLPELPGKPAVRRAHPQPRHVRIRTAPPPGLGRAHGDDRRQLRGIPAHHRRPRDPRPALDAGQSPALAPDRRIGPALDQPPAPADRRFGLSDLAGLAPAAGHRHRSGGHGAGRPRLRGRYAAQRAVAHRAAAVRPQGDGHDLGHGRQNTPAAPSVVSAACCVRSRWRCRWQSCWRR